MSAFCSSCGTELTPGARFCASCGTPAAHSCGSCGAELPAGAAFCPACGATQDGDPTPDLTANEELRVISAMFVDLAGFTAHTERSDPEDVRDRLSIYHRKVREDVERYGGTVEKLMGDGVFAVFGVPTAHEDDAERAVRAGLRIQTSITDVNQADDSLDLSVRVGIATGQAIVLLDDDGVDERIVGDVVNTASRLEGVAAPGSVVVDERTYLAVRSAVECTPLDPVSVKGKAEALAIWTATDARSRFGVAVDHDEPTVLIGRRQELTLLSDAFERAVSRGAPQLVTVAGEPGVGKSRLVQEFLTVIDNRPDHLVRWRQGRNLPYGEGITFWALSEIVKSEAGILESESQEKAAAKLADSVASLCGGVEGVDATWIRQRLGPLAGTGSAEGVDRGELFSAWLQYFELLAGQNPLVMVIEDLHWADDSLADFLEHLLDWGQDAPILLICTARPEWFDRRPGWGGGKRDGLTIGLASLDADETAHLVTALTGRIVMPANAQLALMERSEGNPLYVTEYVRLASEQGWFESGFDLDDLPLPDSVQSIIASRLDLLDPEDKATIQAASVVGRVFWTGALTFVRGVDETPIRESLLRLVRRELVQPVRRTSMEDQNEFVFLHVLARDVAYGQLPRGERARLHRETARWLEAVSGGREIDVAELLAYHHTTALELEPSTDPELLGRVYRFLVLAGERTESLDMARATEFYSRAAEIASTSKERANALFGRGKLPTGHGQERIDALIQAIALFAELEDDRARADALQELSTVHWWLGDKTPAQSAMTEAMTLIETMEPNEVVGRVLVSQAFHHQLGGNEELGLELSERAIAIAQKIGDTKTYADALRCKGTSLTQMGLIEGLDQVREGLAIQLDRGETASAMSSYNNIATVLGDTGDAVEAIAFGRQRGAVQFVEWSMMTKCESLVRIGAFDEIEAIVTELIEVDDARGGSQTGIFARSFRTGLGWIRGETRGIWDAHKEAVEEGHDVADPQVVVPILAGAIAVAESFGRIDDATNYMDHFVSQGVDNPAFLGMHLYRTAAGFLSAGRRDELVSLIDSAMAIGDWIPLTLDWVRALVAEFDGRPDEAYELFIPVIREADSRHMRFYATQARVEAARCAISAGRSEEAAALTAEAREAATDMGAGLLLRQLDDIEHEAEGRAAGA